ncbi:ABC transporter ATP-binding protein [Thermoanaerobacteraceae bacterium SP2]|nr:ABC transporter ATP-binding protein [Thermoanaerobacteraceae bacterium SP2]
MLLSVKNLSVSYGGIKAVSDLNLEINKGEIVTIIGANGAGKTSTIHAISGVVAGVQGEIIFNGRNIIKEKCYARVKLGIVEVPEGRHIFPKMSVLDNLLMGAYLYKDKENIDMLLERIYKYFPILEKRKKQNAGTLSGGEQQMLAIGRALMSRPQLLLLDEPSLGLAPIMIDKIYEIIDLIHSEGTTILLVEQNAHQALAVSDRGYVLQNGKVVLSGPAYELANNEMVKKVYLGADVA